MLIKKVAILSWKKSRLCNPNSATGQFILKNNKSFYLYVKHFNINNVHTNLEFVNSRNFLRKNQLFCTSLNGIVFPSTVFTTWRQTQRKNNCLGYESHVPTIQSLAFNSVDLGIRASSRFSTTTGLHIFFFISNNSASIAFISLFFLCICLHWLVIT